MRRQIWICGLLMLASSAAGCRCFPGFNSYADFIDDVHDYPVLFDQWYNPRLDISRAGRPDWCGPVNRRLAPCRCDGEGCWDRADECWRYPAGHPYWYPAQALHSPGAPMPVNQVPPVPADQGPLMPGLSSPPAPVPGEIPPVPASEFPAPAPSLPEASPPARPGRPSVLPIPD